MPYNYFTRLILLYSTKYKYNMNLILHGKIMYILFHEDGTLLLDAAP